MVHLITLMLSLPGSVIKDLQVLTP